MEDEADRSNWSPKNFRPDIRSVRLAVHARLHAHLIAAPLCRQNIQL